MTNQPEPRGPDLTLGIASEQLAEGDKIVGHVGEEAVLLVRRGTEFFAIGALCTHYHGPLADGLVVRDTIRCPWHHASFDLRTGEAVQAPAFDPLPCWTVEQRGGKIFVLPQQRHIERSEHGTATPDAPDRIVIVGGGAAGFAAVEMLRREQFKGSIVVLSAEDAPPVDRPNLSKDYLAGTAPEDWVPLRPASFYSDNNVDLRLSVDVVGIRARMREVTLADGTIVPFDRLLLATGAEPVRLSIPGADQPHVHTLRSLADCSAIIARAKTARRAVVLGASFIGLEVAAALRVRGIEIHVVAPERRPMERVLGAKMGDFIRALHEEHGVVFHLGEMAAAIEGQNVRLKSGRTLAADLVIAGIGVRPRIALAEKAGLAVDRGVLVDPFLKTSAPDIFAAGDIARWPDPHTGEAIRVEHWVVAQRQGQTAALNILGHGQAFAAVPFFWSQHYDIPINYVGHAETWDELIMDGDIAGKDCLLRFRRKGRTLAVASIFRDLENLHAEMTMERSTAAFVSSAAHREKMLDEALAETFPASDPIAVAFGQSPTSEDAWSRKAPARKVVA